MATIPAILPESDAIKPDKIYTPSEAYLSVANLDLKNEQSQKKLLILDLNGALISRLKPKKRSPFFARTHIYAFMDYIFTDYKVMIWSSAQERTVEHICQMFGDRPILLKWHRGHFGFNISEFHSKVEAIKNLERVWDELPEFNATNTVVIDDTSIKLSLQPYNLIKISTFDHTNMKKGGDNTLIQLIDYLKLLKDEPNVAFYIKNNPFVEIENFKKESGDEACIEFEFNGRLKRPWEATSPLQSSAEATENIKKKKKPRHKKIKKLLQSTMIAAAETTAETAATETEALPAEIITALSSKRSV